MRRQPLEPGGNAYFAEALLLSAPNIRDASGPGEQREDATQNRAGARNPLTIILVNVPERAPPHKLLICELSDLQTYA